MSHHASGPNFGFPRGEARLDKHAAAELKKHLQRGGDKRTASA
jgi:hypothetical protein